LCGQLQPDLANGHLQLHGDLLGEPALRGQFNDTRVHSRALLGHEGLGVALGAELGGCL
jgi:hypothetical protein